MKIVINYMSHFFRGKLKIVLKDVAKQSAQQKTKKSGKKKQQPVSKKQSLKNKCVTKYKKKQKEPKKKKGKSVNSLPASEFDNEPDTSTEKVIPNNSIDLSNKESLSEEERNVNGVKESNDSRLSNEAVTGTQGIKEVQEHVPKHKKKKTSVTTVDLGPNSDCSEQDSQCGNINLKMSHSQRCRLNWHQLMGKILLNRSLHFIKILKKNKMQRQSVHFSKIRKEYKKN